MNPSKRQNQRSERAAFSTLLLALALASGCGPKLVTQPVYEAESEGIDVVLRHRVQGGSPVHEGHTHPTVISEIRLAHILGLLAVSRKGKQDAVFRPAQIYPLAQGLRRGLEQAGPDQEVAVRAFYVERNLGVFTSSYVTAFRAFARDDNLILEFFEIASRLERTSRDPSLRNYQLPKQLPDSDLGASLAGGQAHRPHGKRGVAIEWRHPLYREPISFTATGGVQRRQILMEAEPESEAPAAGESIAITPELQRAQMAALDQLDALRRSGEIPESEFQRRRRLILEGKVEESGYEPQP